METPINFLLRGRYWHSLTLERAWFSGVLCASYQASLDFLFYHFLFPPYLKVPIPFIYPSSLISCAFFSINKKWLSLANTLSLSNRKFKVWRTWIQCSFTKRWVIAYIISFTLIPLHPSFP